MKWKLSLTCSVFFGKSLTLFSGPLIIPDMFESVQRWGRFHGGTGRGFGFFTGGHCPSLPFYHNSCDQQAGGHALKVLDQHLTDTKLLMLSLSEHCKSVNFHTCSCHTYSLKAAQCHGLCMCILILLNR